MKYVTAHVVRCLVAGIVAVLPVGGLVLGLVLAERTLSESWLARQAWYFPGLGILAAAVGVYLLGLVVTTFVGRWFWKRVDRLLDNLPALGRLYRTLKQILGYGEGEDAIFKRVVLLPTLAGGHELGLVTGEVAEANRPARLVVFVPGAPNPTLGRLVLAAPESVVATPLPVSEAFQVLLSAGAVALQLERGAPAA